VIGRKISILLRDKKPNSSTQHYKFVYSYFKLKAPPPHYKNQPINAS